MLHGLVVSDGGYDFTAIQVVFDQWEKETGKRADMAMFSKIIRLIDVVEKERRARQKK